MTQQSSVLELRPCMERRAGERPDPIMDKSQEMDVKVNSSSLGGVCGLEKLPNLFRPGRGRVPFEVMQYSQPADLERINRMRRL